MPIFLSHNFTCKRHNESSILISFLATTKCIVPFVFARVSLLYTGRFLSLLRERELNCCRVIVHIARRYSLRNWVKQLTIGIQATSQAHLRECTGVVLSTRKIIAFGERFSGAPSITNIFHVPPRKIINSINHETSNITRFNSKDVRQRYLVVRALFAKVPQD